MAYSTQAEVQLAAGGSRQLRELSDQEVAGSVNATVVAKAIAAADTWINSFLEKRYEIDLADVPESIQMLSAIEAVFLMKLWRGMVTDDDRAARDERLTLLRAHAAGDNTLGLDERPEASDLVVDSQSERGTDKEVSRANLKGFW